MSHPSQQLNEAPDTSPTPLDVLRAEATLHDTNTHFNTLEQSSHLEFGHDDIYGHVPHDDIHGHHGHHGHADIHDDAMAMAYVDQPSPVPDTLEQSLHYEYVHVAVAIGLHDDIHADLSDDAMDEDAHQPSPVSDDSDPGYWTGNDLVTWPGSPFTVPGSPATWPGSPFTLPGSPATLLSPPSTRPGSPLLPHGEDPVDIDMLIDADEVEHILATLHILAHEAHGGHAFFGAHVLDQQLDLDGEGFGLADFTAAEADAAEETDTLVNACSGAAARAA